MSNPTCPACGDGRATIMGWLGKLLWVRCVACGAEYHRETDHE